MSNLSPKFEIVTLKDRVVNRTVYKKEAVAGEEKKFQLVPYKYTETVAESFMVYFPGKHSVWFETRAAMAAAGVALDDTEEVDLDTGLPATPPQAHNLQRDVESLNERNSSNVLRSI